MEAKHISENESTAASFPLNYDCLVQLFKRMDLEECMNMAEAYEELQCAADFVYKTKFNKLSINFDVCINIDRILYHVGPYVQSLELQLLGGCSYAADKMKVIQENLLKIQATCKELKSLKIIGFEGCRYPFCGAADTFEELTLSYCHLEKDDDFFNNLNCLNLKSLKIMNCTDVSDIAIEQCFLNNQGIKSFVCDSPSLMYRHLLRRLPNLERVELRYDSRLMNLSFVTRLNSLRSLTLHCENGNENNNSILSELATISGLEELQLYNAVVDGKTFEILKTFRNLQLLTVTSPTGRFIMSHELPLQLKTLKLGGFRSSQRQIVLLISQREHLKNIHLADCILNTKRDFNSIANSIGQQVRNLDGRKVNMTMTTSSDKSSKVNYSR